MVSTHSSSLFWVGGVPNNLAVDSAGDAVLQLQVHLGDGVVGEDGGVRDITCRVGKKKEPVSPVLSFRVVSNSVHSCAALFVSVPSLCCSMSYSGRVDFASIHCIHMHVTPPLPSSFGTNKQRAWTVSGRTQINGERSWNVRMAADSTMLRMVNLLMALSLGVQRAQLEQRTGLTWPRPFLLRPL